MMSVSSPQCSMPSSSPFLKEESVSCMRIRDMTGNRFASRSASGVTLQESHGRSADAGVLRRIDAGSWKRRTPGSTGFESFSSDMRSYLKATRRSFISLLRSSVGGRWLLFTDKSLVLPGSLNPYFQSVPRPLEVLKCFHLLLTPGISAPFAGMPFVTLLLEPRDLRYVLTTFRGKLRGER